MVRKGYEPVLKKKHGCLLKRPLNLTDNQCVSLRELLGCNLNLETAVDRSPPLETPHGH